MQKLLLLSAVFLLRVFMSCSCFVLVSGLLVFVSVLVIGVGPVMTKNIKM